MRLTGVYSRHGRLVWNMLGPVLRIFREFLAKITAFLNKPLGKKCSAYDYIKSKFLNTLTLSWFDLEFDVGCDGSVRFLCGSRSPSMHET